MSQRRPTVAQVDVQSAPVAEVERAMSAIRRSQSRRALSRLAGEHDPALFEVTDAVAEHEESGHVCTVTSVAAALGVDQPRGSRLVARAINRDLVCRAGDPADGRISRLLLTAAGRAYLDEVRTFRHGFVARAMDDWTEPERVQFAHLLERFVAGTRRAATGGRPNVP
jgi:DNA-binding MarR family transcriptional regulator